MRVTRQQGACHLALTLRAAWLWIPAGARGFARLDAEGACRSRIAPQRALGDAAPMQDVIRVQCPYCFEELDLYVDPESRGGMVQDCDVCCRPWQLHVERDERGELWVSVERAQ